MFLSNIISGVINMGCKNWWRERLLFPLLLLIGAGTCATLFDLGRKGKCKKD